MAFTPSSSLKGKSGGCFSILLFLQFVIYSISLIVAGQEATSCTFKDTYMEKSYPLSREMPVRYDFNSLKFSLLFSLPDNSMLKGNISLNQISLKSKCTLPILPKPFREIAFYSLNLTQIDLNQNSLSLEIGVESHVPTFFNLDPYSYWIALYNAQDNSCKYPGTFSQKGTRFTTTIDLYDSFIFGVFVFKDVQNVKFDRSVSIHYPRSISFMCTNNIKSVLYTFPKAAYVAPTLSPFISVGRYYVSYSDIPEGYYILARFQVSLFNQPLNLTEATIDIGFNRAKYDFDISNNLIEMSFESLTCMFLIEGKIHQLESRFNDETTSLTCLFNQEYNVDHDMFIAVKSAYIPTISSSMIPALLEGNTAERINLSKGGSKAFKILIPRGYRLLIQVNFPDTTLLTDGLPIYLATDTIPSNQHYSKVFVSSGYYNNDELRSIWCYILVENPQYDTCIITLTPSLEFADAMPFVNSNTLTILFAVLSGVLCSTLIPLLCALFIIIRRNERMKLQMHIEENLSGYGCSRP
ncbi:predicted protein [Naegleria gruberi]|uniref:Predicted protein n=1 Tax=Naegleria gruberi TaxID=5762 RepID=D2VK75_NAEGR|nr:uncharacterized protein NAEGRDRAFT_69294 [Naegleria gruberi]EFC42899.1 predicted protein [Naegleria gruberi]|eukprot:XP_002675643.1 predicted protein [Naegleria gruberi strain NEG-M]